MCLGKLINEIQRFVSCANGQSSKTDLRNGGGGGGALSLLRTQNSSVGAVSALRTTGQSYQDIVL